MAKKRKKRKTRKKRKAKAEVEAMPMYATPVRPAHYGDSSIIRVANFLKSKQKKV